MAGPGGVGKTTLSSVLAIKLSLSGFRTLVLTVDPAKRLANALGLNSFKDEIEEIKLPGGAGLFATMLDTKHYFDKVIERFSTSKEQVDKILNHRLYRTAIDSLGGTEEYAAMERVLEFSEDKSFDKIVIDTPPIQNAHTLLNAPLRMSDFMDASVLKWFTGSVGLYSKVLKVGAEFSIKLLGRIFGKNFLSELAGFLVDMEGMHEKFKNRSLELMRVLSGDEATFILVNYPNIERIAEMKNFLQVLDEKEYHCGAILFNRMEPKRLSDIETSQATSGLKDWVKHFQRIYELETSAIQSLSSESQIPIYKVFKTRTPPQDIDSLKGISLKELS